MKLTKRESDVLNLVSLGQTNKEIADKLCLDVRTIKWYVYKLLKKYQVRNRTELAIEHISTLSF